ncbi:hypothetical protein COEREDRAFT_82464 [Coemansia reversa NRRL 1564]|uniref:Uncharacterized protein n=1 Tax=Coemansia reversa (strain ATCC 12441 / NRRL 1564) TaxID=763665 RepID=A0A2G5B7A6_COERN|nr:hypothetical protein COEREDRAFT_82464 [Coemansia reversa NRRL 1564]|eukprot:PIA14864.1 hypothetical protein COEREDRAFT_82464 [Coemansia reversa NRRL 1564]
MQFPLPGRTSSVLSSGVVAYPNDPMIPRGRYFKPKGLSKFGSIMPLMLGKHLFVYKHNSPGFMLCACPWNVDEHPRDHNGLRFRDFRVSLMVTKKRYDKRAHERWRMTRLLRTAASLILPDKGLKRCDYLFFARAPLLKMDRDKIFLEVEDALVSIEQKIRRDWGSKDVRKRKRRPEMAVSKHESDELLDTAPKTAPDSASIKILNVVAPGSRPVSSLSEVIVDLSTLNKKPIC